MPAPALEYTKQLVAFESTSPLSNVAVTDFVHETLQRLGCQPDRVEYEDAKGVRKANVIGKMGDGVG